MKEEYKIENITAGLPWLDLRLSEKVMNYLWDIINIPAVQQTSAKTELAGNISKSSYIQDKDNWFYENVLKQCVETIYYKKWDNYYNVHVTKSVPAPVFSLKELWVNYQKQHEFNPVHNHAGMFSFVVFMKIPTHWKEQHALPWMKDVKEKRASNFQFLLGGVERGNTDALGIHTVDVSLSPEDESRMLFFPAWLNHQVYPFYDTEKERITVSGNIFPSAIDSPKIKVDKLEKNITYLQNKIKTMKVKKVQLEKIYGKELI